MLSKNKIKLIKSLAQKKYRNLHNLYVVEGEKIVKECLTSGRVVEHLILTSSLSEEIEKELLKNVQEISIIDERDLQKVSLLSTSGRAIAVMPIPEEMEKMPNVENELSLVLDTIQDPGNMGTIIRIADWYGIKNIFCSKNTVDQYNPKVLQSTMGSFLRVNVHYCELLELLEKYSEKVGFKIYGTFLDGDNLYEEPIQAKGFIVIGNESKGVSEILAPKITQRLFIPGYPPGQQTAESLNASIATALVCAEFRRRGK